MKNCNSYINLVAGHFHTYIKHNKYISNALKASARAILTAKLIP